MFVLELNFFFSFRARVHLPRVRAITFFLFFTVVSTGQDP